MCCEIYFVLLQILLLNLAWKHCVTIIGISGAEMMFLEMLCQVSRGIAINLKIIIIISDNSCRAMHVRGKFRAKNAAKFYWETLQNPVIDLSSPNYRTINQKIDFLPFWRFLTMTFGLGQYFQTLSWYFSRLPGIPDNRGVNLVILLPRRFTTTLVKPPWTPIYRHPLGIQWRQPTFGHFIWISFGWS